MAKPKAALWLRVSDPDRQTNENQLAPLETECNRRGFEIAMTYEVGASAYHGYHLKTLNQAFTDAKMGRFNVLMVWSIDRLSRQGVGPTFEAVNRFLKSGVKVVSLQEPWLDVEGPAWELLLAASAWVAKYESQRRSERTKAGLERTKASGKTLGRPKGSKDKKKRTRSGYFARYAY